MIFKKFMLILMMLSLMITPCMASETEEDLDISSEHIVVYNLDDGHLIYEQNKDEKVSIASITKAMSAITVIDNVDDLNEMVTIGSEVFYGTEEYSLMGLSVGDRISVKDLLYGLMLPSGADAANALAIHTAGSVEKFADLMNQKAQELKMKNSHFDNPVGADSKENYSTAYDLAQLLMYGLKNKTFKDVYTTRNYRIDDLNIDLESTILNYRDTYGFDISNIKGSKTGFTYDAGTCLSSIAEYNDIQYLMVVLGSDVNVRYSAVQDSLTLYEYYEKNYDIHKIVTKDELVITLPIKHGFEESYSIYTPEDFSAYLKNDYHQKDIHITFDGVKELTYKTKENDVLGTISVAYKDEVLKIYEVTLNTKLRYYDPILLTMIGVIVGFFLLLVLLRMINITRYKIRRKKRLAKMKQMKRK